MDILQMFAGRKPGFKERRANKIDKGKKADIGSRNPPDH
jgi:hypothetical protein